MPSIEYLTRRGAQQHGDTIYDYRLARRVIQLLERVDACSRSDYWDRRAEMLNILRPNRQLANTFEMGFLRKYLSNGDIRDIQVLVEEGPVFAARNLDVWDEWAFTEAIRFVAPDPTFYDPDLKSAVFVLTLTDHLIFPFSFSGYDMVFSGSVIDSSKAVTYNGTWLTYPTITIVGPLDGVTVTNLTTGEFIRLNYSISIGRTVTISLEFGNKTVIDNLGNNLIGALSPDSDLAAFHIAPAPEANLGINTLNVRGSNAAAGDTIISVVYYERYVGL
jgi:hypothetical protein